MKIFLSTCLFLAILSEVIAVECNVKNPGEDDLEETCIINKGSCFTRIIESYIDDFLDYQTEMGCTTNCTTENYSFTTREGDFIRSSRACCQGLECLKKFNRRPRRRLNGKECPTCHPALSEGCKGSKTIKCYNDETQCIEFVVAHDDSAIPDKLFYGCASPKFCELTKNSMHINALSGTITRARCCGTLPPLEQSMESRS